MKIEYATADYTGGGIYILHGKCDEGYFLTGNAEESVLVLDADPSDYDESLYYDWQEAHTIREYVEEYDSIYADIVNWIGIHHPEGNYIFEEL